MRQVHLTLMGLCLLVATAASAAEVAAPTLRQVTIEPTRAAPGDHVVLTVRLDDPSQQVAAIEAVVTEFTIIRLALNDRGEGADQQAGDGVWSGGMDVPMEAPEGTFHLALRLTDAAGKPLDVSTQSVAASLPFDVQRYAEQELNNEALRAGAAPWKTQVRVAGMHAAPGEWHHPLYLGDGGYWRRRLAVAVRNGAERDAAGDPVELRVGGGAGEADLVGAAAEAVRVCDAKGIEMLFRLRRPNGETLTRGAVPAGATITLPVECPAGGATTYYIYFDNPAAWVVPDFLDVSKGQANANLAATPGRPESLQLDEIGADAPWYDEDPNDDIVWPCRVPIKVVNVSARPLNFAVLADIATVTARFAGTLNADSLRVTDGAQVLPHALGDDRIIFPAAAPARTAHAYYLYFSFDQRIKPGDAATYEGAEVIPITSGRLQWRPEALPSGPAMWPVNAIAKVFHDDAPPREIPPARISAARNESEPLQLAVRSPVAVSGLKVEVDPPVNAQGARLSDITVGVVGYVPVDHKTSYYRDDSLPWHRKFPTAKDPTALGACDGWPDMWPDPLLPRDTFDLAAGVAQPIWVTVRVAADAAAGDYFGTVRLLDNGAAVAEAPFTVHVWDFALPDETHLPAVYDVRLGERWSVPGQTAEQTRRQLWRFMAERRVCPDQIDPAPVITYENGKVVADFTEFDRAGRFYFDELKLPMTYTPNCFYLFGWGHPPRDAFGEAPYEGEHPYRNVDRSRLRPEYKRAYQACLKAYWDHMKEKGWHRKCVLYLCDEPAYADPQVRTQLQALCDMIHEVDPEIPIYSSPRYHGPAWDGYLDVWGIFQNGMVSPRKMAELRAAGDRLWFTTDSQLCSDTPYCAIERLLPHYCFHYDVEAYEFWGISWLTYDPYQFGWHAYIPESEEPGKSISVRYPNGDGYLAYPGKMIGHSGPVSSVRLEQAREGLEDYEYLRLLRERVRAAQAAGADTAQAREALEMAAGLVSIPNAGGLYSSRILPDPDAVFGVKDAVARAIEGLSP